MMTDMPSPGVVSSRPHRTIACQDLLSTPDVGHSGFLRKQLICKKKGMNVIVSTLTKTLKIPWVQRYVVLSGGSLYHYDNEMSKQPTGSYSLKHYNQVVRAGDITHSSHPWAFKICHDTQPNNAKYFSAASENDMKKWQLEIRTQLILANGLDGKSGVPSDVDEAIYSPSDFGSDCSSEGSSSDSGDYIEIEDEIVEKKLDPQLRLNRGRPPPTPSEGETKPTGRKPSFQKSGDDKPLILNHMFKDGTVKEDPDDPEIDPSPVKAVPQGNRTRPPALLPDTPSNKVTVKPLPSLPGPKSPPTRALPPSPAATIGNSSLGNSHSNDSYGDEDEPAVNSVMDRAKKFGVQMIGPPKMGKPKLQRKPENLPREAAKEPLKLTKSGSLDTSKKIVPTPPPTPRKKELPPTPTSTHSVDKLLRRDYFWEGHDKDTCQQILKNVGIDGVFMVRDSDSGHGQTLMCFCRDENMVRKYKITKLPDNQFTIKMNSDWNFRTMEELLTHYMHNNLPNRPTQLSSPYNKHC